jgi:hypothetical protein
MNPVDYYLTVSVNAFRNILPLVVFLVGGYFIFFKLPFFLLRKNLQNEKNKLSEENNKVESPKKIDSNSKAKSQIRIKIIKSERSQEKRASSSSEENVKNQKNQKKNQTPEEVFNLKPHETITQAELKKRYFELLKKNHPDRVASMGEDFKKLAEKNTKDINEAYEKLRIKAS